MRYRVSAGQRDRAVADGDRERALAADASRASSRETRPSAASISGTAVLADGAGACPAASRGSRLDLEQAAIRSSSLLGERRCARCRRARRILRRPCAQQETSVTATLPPVSFVKAAEAGIAVGMQEAAEPSSNAARMLALAIGRVAVDDRRRRRAALRALIADRPTVGRFWSCRRPGPAPEPACRRRAGGAAAYIAGDRRRQGLEQERHAGQPSRPCVAAARVSTPSARVDAALPVQRQCDRNTWRPGYVRAAPGPAGRARSAATAPGPG